MTRDEATRYAVVHYLKKAEEALASARSELEQGRRDYSISRSYYACFYAVTAVLIHEGRKFGKHTSVRAALHECVIRPGKLSAEFGEWYNDLFNARHIADYQATTVFTAGDAETRLTRAERFVAAIKAMLSARDGGRDQG